MLHTLPGAEGFRRVPTCISDRHVASVTCDDFIKALKMPMVPTLPQFNRWYSQGPGIPAVWR